MDRLKKHTFIISVVVLVIILAVVSFYMLYVHIPYYQYHHELDEIRNEICEENNYEYMGYFDQYNSKETYYLIRVKINGVLSHVAYDKDKKLVDMYQGEVADEDTVKQAIQDRYKIEVKDLNIGYENDLFVYWTKYQNQTSLTYIYYDLVSGEFIKAVQIEDGDMNG